MGAIIDRLIHSSLSEYLPPPHSYTHPSDFFPFSSRPPPRAAISRLRCYQSWHLLRFGPCSDTNTHLHAVSPALPPSFRGCSIALHLSHTHTGLIKILPIMHALAHIVDIAHPDMNFQLRKNLKFQSLFTQKNVVIIFPLDYLCSHLILVNVNI